MSRREVRRLLAVVAMLTSAAPGTATADAYRENADIMIDIATSTIVTAGLKSLIWRLEETERCAVQLIYGEEGGILRDGFREKWRTDIPLGSIDPDRIERQSSLGITVHTHDGAASFQRETAAAPGVVEAESTILLPVRYHASADDLIGAVRALAEICR